MKTPLVLNSIFLLMTVAISAKAQTYSDDEITIRDMNFARFSIALEEADSIKQNLQGYRYVSILKKNLCWSGIFVVFSNQKNSYCSSKRSPDFILQVAIDDSAKLVIQLKNTSERFHRRLAINEQEIMTGVNQLVKFVTGTEGVLGSTIAFTFKQPRRRKIIARINTHGKKLDRISKNQAINIAPKWSPQGDAIVYTALRQRKNILIYNSLEQPETVLGEYPGINSGGTWFPDQSHLILNLSKDGNPELYQFNIFQKSLLRLTFHASIEASPALSPDGKYLLFVSDRGGNEQIYLMYLQTRETFRITFTGQRNADPKWHPNGKLLAFTKTVLGYDQIYIMDIFGEISRQITQGKHHSEQPVWSPDGRMLAFTSNRTGTYKLYIATLDGKDIRRVTDTPNGFEEKSPSWTQRKF